MKIICLDTEFISATQELLEISIFGLNGKEIYRSRFRPVKARTWSSEIHGITPEMVASSPTFKERKTEIQRIINAASHIIGFAIGNDISILESSGIKKLKHLQQIDVRDLYWLCRGKELGYTLFNGPGLAQCAADMGIPLSDDDEHTASGDTQATLSLFKRLSEVFAEKYTNGERFGYEEMWSRASSLIEKERREHYRRAAHGFLHLMRYGDTYSMKTTTEMPIIPNPHIIASIEVDDRYRAEYELTSRLQNRFDGRIVKLSDRQIRFFKGYTNTYEEEKAPFFRKIMKRR